MVVSVIPVPAYPSSGTQLRVDDGRVTLGLTADFQYTLLNASGVAVALPSRNTLTTGQYAGWTGDDTYVCACVAANVGLTAI